MEPEDRSSQAETGAAELFRNLLYDVSLMRYKKYWQQAKWASLSQSSLSWKAASTTVQYIENIIFLKSCDRPLNFLEKDWMANYSSSVLISCRSSGCNKRDQPVQSQQFLSRSPFCLSYCIKLPFCPQPFATLICHTEEVMTPFYGISHVLGIPWIDLTSFKSFDT